jgi:aryl-alcohol dehydrogenase-like predicted oxidoreductase
LTQVAWTPVSRRIGNTGMAVYPLALDGSVFGWAADTTATAESIDLFVGVGGNLISTADHYAGGRSEVMIGSWLRRSQQRDHLVIATKVGKHPDALGLHAETIRRAVDASLERLSTEYIDLLSFDGDDPSVPLEESLTAVAELIAAGKVHHLSAAGWTGERLREAVRVAHRLELTGITTVLTEYNLLEREPYESDIAPVAFAQDLGVLARMPLAYGYLLGEFRTKADRPASPMFAPALRYVGRRGNRVLQVLDDLAWETGASIGQLALAWVLSKPLISAPVVRVKDARILLELLPAVDLDLTPEQLDRLDRLGAR